MTDDMFATMDDSELDEEASEEVDKILWEITAGTHNIHLFDMKYIVHGCMNHCDSTD